MTPRDETPDDETPLPQWAPDFLLALEEVGTIAGAAKKAAVGRRTVYDEAARNPVFDTAMREITGACLENVETTLYQRAVSGEDTTATIFFLKCRRPEVYGERRLKAEEVEQIKVATRLQLVAELQAEIKKLTPEARKLLMNALPSAQEAPDALG